VWAGRDGFGEISGGVLAGPNPKNPNLSPRLRSLAIRLPARVGKFRRRRHPLCGGYRQPAHLPGTCGGTDDITLNIGSPARE
jgi:hypothetical protein